VCIGEEQGRALSTFTIMAGIGGCVGYLIGAVNWNNTIFANIIGDNITTGVLSLKIIFQKF
jgi:solute carrier family 45 protein 1/2/4